MGITAVITDAGFDLLRAAPGHQLIYTRAVCGEGYVDQEQLNTLTEIVDYVMDLSIVDFKPTESAATIRLQLDNRNSPREFPLYQIGVYAKLMDGEDEILGDTLVQVMQYDKPDLVRSIPHVSEFVVNVLLGRAKQVGGVLDLAAYVSIRQFNRTIQEIYLLLSGKSSAVVAIGERTRDPQKPDYGLSDDSENDPPVESAEE